MVDIDIDISAAELRTAVLVRLAIFTSAKEVMFLPEFVCLSVCMSVCLCVSKITQDIVEGSFWNFQGMSGMAKTTNDLILGVIRKFELVLTRRAVNMLVC